jgi:hypothetical protein
MLVLGNSLIITAVLENWVLKFVVDNSGEIVEDVDGVKNVFVMTFENGSLLVSGVSVMIIALLENSVLKYVANNSYDIEEEIDGVKNVVVMMIEYGTM